MSSQEVYMPDPFARPGYEIQPFVETFIETEAGPVPKVKTNLSMSDYTGEIFVRLGFGRDEYAISPGLYSVGNPDKESMVLVTANYKLTFDILRKELDGTDAWILVLDTRGINVWCAAGRGTFSTEELIRRIRLTGLERLVAHRNLLLPQLGATGVSKRDVKKRSGFNILWGPIRAGDLKKFMENGMKKDDKMRNVSFSLAERVILVPVEINIAFKPSVILIAALMLLSCVSGSFSSFSYTFSRMAAAAVAVFSGILAGAFVTPVLLPWIYGRAFAVKGLIAGSIAGLLMLLYYGSTFGLSGGLGLSAVLISISSYLAMNFTGSTPYASPSGVEWEMRRFIPIQLGLLILGTGLWIYSAF